MSRQRGCGVLLTTRIEFMLAELLIGIRTIATLCLLRELKSRTPEMSYCSGH